MPHLPFSSCKRRAFSLIPALFFTALTLSCAFGLIALAAIHKRESDHLKNRQQAQNAVRAGTLIALGELQMFTGTDDCATAKIANNGVHPWSSKWLGAWHGTRILKESPPFVALVSNRGTPTGTTFCRFANSENPEHPVNVPWEKVGENTRIAFFIRDESLCASIKKRERVKYLALFKTNPAALMRLRQKIARQTNFGDFFEEENTAHPDFRKKIDCAYDEKIFLFPLLEKLPKNKQAALRETFTLEALGVPVDGQKKQLKIDLSDKTTFSRIENHIPEKALEFSTDETAFPHTGVLVAKTPPQIDEKTSYFTHPFPIVAELKLHLGFFNPRSDGQHRARFHVTTRFWNPYPFPLLAHGDGRLGLFDVENLPFISIKNENTEGEITFSPSNFPIGQFGLVRQTPSDKTCNAYGRIFDASRQGFGEHGNESGLHGGEVFLARFPDPQGQPSGLARNIGGPSWKYQKNLNYVDKPPSGAKKGAWFHPAHTLSIESFPNVLPTSFMIRGDAGSLKQQTSPADYANPVVHFKNVELPSFSLKISGENYNREKAGDYVISQANVVWKIRLRAEDPEAMTTLFKTIDPRLGIFDFSIPAVACAFEVSTLSGATAEAESEIGGKAESASNNPSPLRDRFANEHATFTPDAFSCIRIFDVPRAPTVSAAAFRHFSFSSRPPLASIGEPFSETQKETPNAIFDRVFFSAQGKHPHVVPAGKSFLISGAFNINSENANAWAAQFSHDIPNWKPFFESAVGARPKIANAEKHLKRAVFIHPHSAQMARPTIEDAVFSDQEIAKKPAEARETALLSQSLREIEKTRWFLFSEKIVALLKERRSRGKSPFRSIEEFANSGLLKTALQECQFNVLANTEIPAWFPSAISQSVLLESLSTCAFPRGDTFTIFCRADVFDPFSKKNLSSACAEMRVQRLPEFFDTSQSAETPEEKQNALNRAFGRRYKILTFRFLPTDEL